MHRRTPAVARRRNDGTCRCPVPGGSGRRARRRRGDPDRHVRVDEGTRAGRHAGPKYGVAQEAIEAMLDATDAFVARRPDFPIKIGLYSFSSSVRRCCGRSSRTIAAAIRAALARLPRPGGGTAIGDAMREARPDLYRAGVFRKYLLVVTDGENTQRPRARRGRARDLAQERGRGADLFRRLRHEPGEVRVPQGRRRRRDRRRHGPRAAARRSTASTRARFWPRRTTPASGNPTRSSRSYTRFVEGAAVILHKFWSAFMAQINKVANLFWEADPIAQMQLRVRPRRRAAQGRPRRASSSTAAWSSA